MFSMQRIWGDRAGEQPSACRHPVTARAASALLLLRTEPSPQRRAGNYSERVKNTHTGKNLTARSKCILPLPGGVRAGGCSLWEESHSPSRPSPTQSGRALVRGLCPAPPSPPQAQPRAAHCSAAGQTPGCGGDRDRAVGTRGRQVRTGGSEGRLLSQGVRPG